MSNNRHRHGVARAVRGHDDDDNGSVAGDDVEAKKTKVYLSFNGPRRRQAVDYRPKSSHLKPGPRVTVGWLKQRESYLFQHETGRDYRFLLPANVTIRDILRMFRTFPETIDGFLDKEDLPDFLEYVGIALKSQREVWAAITKVLGQDNDGLIDSEEIQKFFLAKPVYVPTRRDHTSRRQSRQGLRTARNASREAARLAARRNRVVVVNPKKTRAGAKPFCNYKKYKKLETKRKKLGHLVKHSGRAKGSWHSFPKYANMSAGVPYSSLLDRQLMEDREKKKRFVAGKDFHAAVASTAKQQEWQRIMKGGGLAHGPYLSPVERERREEKRRKAKFLGGGFHVC